MDETNEEKRATYSSFLVKNSRAVSYLFSLFFFVFVP